jgi:integrase
MPKIAAELGPLDVKRFKTPGLHSVGGVAGLHLQISKSKARSWVLRVMVGGRRRDMGLGGYPTTSLAQARERAREARDKIFAGIDPIAAAQERQSALVAAQATQKTFWDCATAYIDAMSEGWKNSKHRAQWTTTLETYAKPKIGDMLVRDIDVPQIEAVLKPIWSTKPETASRVRGRIEKILDWAKVGKYRQGDNPARWGGNLEARLPKRKVKPVHHSALPIDDVPSFMRRLKQEEGMGARALEFAILTAARSGEVRLAHWDEFDLERGLWIVPAGRMKAGREHRVPLSKPALDLLRKQERRADTPFVFPALRGGSLSDMTLSAVLRRMEVPAVPHGFRSSFKDWAAERTTYPNEMSEMALAHAVSDKVEAAYRRGDLFDKRRKMMDEWARFCASPATAKVIPMKRAKAGA